MPKPPLKRADGAKRCPCPNADSDSGSRPSSRTLMPAVMTCRFVSSRLRARSSGGGFGDPGSGRELMRRLKDAFDPGRVLSHGRYVVGI
ncbi:MAG TPA: hypothetical protein PLW65_31695 [Pseudomonadota bacterium]|nr:hypothetical protein [Pseudomonadota bacterium]